MKNRVTSTNRWSLSTSGSTRASNVGSCCLRFAICFFWLLLVGRPAQAEIKSGDILVVDQLGGTDKLGALILVNPRTGHRSVLSDFGNKDQGDLGNGDLCSVAVGRGGQIYVSALFSGVPGGGGALFEVDPDTGNRKLLSNLSQGDIPGFLYYGLAVNAQGKVIANLIKLVESAYALVRIDPKTDKRALITDLTNRAQGVTESDRFITDLAIERLGTILIGTARGSGQPDSVIFRVDPVMGKRRLLSDFADAAQGADVADLWASRGLAIETSGQILVASGPAPRNLLLRIDPNTGKRKVLSDFDDSKQGNLGVSLAGVALEKSGNIIVGATSDPSVATFSLFRVQPRTGRRVLLSDSNNPAQGGPSLISLTYIAVVP